MNRAMVSPTILLLLEIERLQGAKRRALVIADERSRENVELRAALLEAGHYVAMCLPPDGVTDKLKLELLEQRKRIEQVAASVA
jgi:hypothetical protein